MVFGEEIMDIFLKRRRIVVLALAFLLFLGKCEVKVHPSHNDLPLSSDPSGGVFLYSAHTSYKSTGATKKSTEFSHDGFMPSKSLHRDCNESCQSYLQRLDAYCHQDLLNLSLQQEIAHEGSLDTRETADQFELVHAHVMIRHGDRAPVYPYKIDSPITYECGLTDTTLNWHGLNDFGQVLSLPPSADLKNRFLKLHPGVYRKHCSIGMLTQVGFKQLRSLGALLQTRYKTLLKNFDASKYSARDVFVHSTDMRRTMRSAGAFLVGFLPNYVSVRRPVRLHVSEGTYNHEPPPGIEKIYSSCHGYYDLLDTELKKTGYYRADKMVFHPLLKRLCKMFHISDPSQPIVNRLFDHFMTRGCHNPKEPLPCYRDQCIDFPYALKLFNYSDWNWSHKLPYNSSLVRLLPFLRHSVLEPMKKRISDDDSEGDPFTFKFMLTLSHDDTIMMLLNAVGYRLDAWIPYASRVVFELWRNYKLEYFVRVLYNGEVISGRTLAGKDEGASMGARELIKFEKWSDFVTTGPFRDIDTYNKVCKN